MTGAPERAIPLGVILAGGAASRMGGRAKGLERVGGLRIIDRVAAALAAVSHGLLVVSSRADAAEWLPGATVRPDERAGLGPIGGVLTALRASRRDVLVVGWDMPFVTAAVLAPLLEADLRAPIVLWRSGATVQPLCALYRVAALPLLGDAVAAGRRDIGGIALACGAHVLAADDHAPFVNVNSAGDLARAEELAPATCAPPALAGA